MREVDRQKGFTLIEVLVALGLGSIVLIATVQFIFSLQRVWNETKLTNSFEQHMDGTTFFLQFLLNNSTALEETNEQNGNSGTIQIVKPQWSRGFNEGMLCFVAEPPPSLFAMSDQVEQPSITIYWDLKIEDGLNIKWHPNSEKIESEDDLYSTNISPFVTNLKLWYY